MPSVVPSCSPAMARRPMFCCRSISGGGSGWPSPGRVPPPLLILQDIHLHLGTTPLLTGATLSVGAGERVALVGRNGSGKSTLLRVAAGEVQPESGTRFLQPGATLRSLPQEPDFGDAPTALAYVEAGLGPNDNPYRARWLL